MKTQTTTLKAKKQTKTTAAKNTATKKTVKTATAKKAVSKKTTTEKKTPKTKAVSQKTKTTAAKRTAKTKTTATKTVTKTKKKDAAVKTTATAKPAKTEIKTKTNLHKTEPYFFNISGSRVFWLNLLSLGLYQLYWFYKNWQALRSCGRKVNPVVRGWILPFLYVFQLFNEIRKTISPSRTARICLWAVPILFIADIFLTLLMSEEIINWIMAEIVTLFITSGIMRCVQNAITHYNKEHFPQNETRKHFTSGEAAATFLLPVFFIISLTGQFFIERAEYEEIVAINEPRNFVTAATFKHLSVYPFICAQQGYMMKNYQQAFLNTFSEEMSIYEQKLHEQNLTMTDDWQKQPRSVVSFIFKLTVQELEEIRLNLVKIAAESIGYSGDSIKSAADIISDAEACAALDQTATAIFEKNTTLKQSLREKIKEF